MSSNDTMDDTTMEIDPVALGRAGLNALALAGAAIVARYTSLAYAPSGLETSDGTLPPDIREVLGRALGAFAEPREFGSRFAGQLPGERDAGRCQAEALAAMVQHARDHAGRRDHRCLRGQ